MTFNGFLLAGIKSLLNRNLIRILIFKSLIISGNASRVHKPRFRNKPRQTAKKSKTTPTELMILWDFFFLNSKAKNGQYLGINPGSIGELGWKSFLAKILMSL
jgi:hypothetical protein